MNIVYFNDAGLAVCIHTAHGGAVSPLFFHNKRLYGLARCNFSPMLALKLACRQTAV